MNYRPARATKLTLNKHKPGTLPALLLPSDLWRERLWNVAPWHFAYQDVAHYLRRFGFTVVVQDDLWLHAHCDGLAVALRYGSPRRASGRATRQLLVTKDGKRTTATALRAYLHALEALSV